MSESATSSSKQQARKQASHDRSRNSRANVQIPFLLLLLAVCFPWSLQLWSRQAGQSWVWVLLVGQALQMWIYRPRPLQTAGLSILSLVAVILSFLVLFTFAVVRQSSWLAAVAQLIPLSVILSVIYRGGGNTAWASVLILPILIVGVPGTVTEILTRRLLQPMMRSASIQLSNSGLIHDPDGFVVRTLERELDIQQVLLHPLSWPFFAVAGIITLGILKRSFVQQLLCLPLLLISGVCLAWQVIIRSAALLNSDSSMAGVFWSILIWIIPATLTAASLCCGVIFLTTTVSTRKERTTGPLGVLWNRHVSADPRSWAVPLRFLDQQDRLISPLILISQFTTNWIYSRTGLYLAFFLPGLFALLTVRGEIRVEEDALNRQFERYEELLADVSTEDNPELRTLIMSAILHQNPGRDDILLQLAELEWENDKKDSAYQRIVDLTGSGPRGYPEAHFWLADNALSENPWKKLDIQQIIFHLREGIALRPDNLERKKLLGSLYVQERELVLADALFLELCGEDPRYCLELAAVRVMLGMDVRADEELQKFIGLAELEVEKKPNDLDLRIRVSNVLITFRSLSEGRRILQSVPEELQTPELRRSLATMLLQDFSRRWGGGNDLQSAPVLLQEIAGLDTSSVPFLHAVMKALQQGALLELPDREGMTQAWEDSESGVAEKELGHALLQVIVDSESGLLVELVDRVAIPADIQLDAVKLLRYRDATAEADKLAEKMLANLDNVKDERTRLIAGISILTAQQRFPEALELLETNEELSESAAGQQKRSSIYVDHFDQLAKYPGLFHPDMLLWEVVVDDEEQEMQLLQLLTNAVRNKGEMRPVLQRLVRISPKSEKAELALQQLLAVIRTQSSMELEYFSARGVQLATQKNYDEALSNLRIAYKIAPRPGPALLNNLAVCIARSSTPDGAEALTLIDEAIRQVPEGANFYATRGEVHLLLEQPHAATADLETAIRIDPRNFEAWYYLSLAREKLGDAPRAQEARERFNALREAVE